VPNNPPTTWFDNWTDGGNAANDSFVWMTSDGGEPFTSRPPAARPPTDTADESVAAMHRRWLHHGSPTPEPRADHSRGCEPANADLLAGVQLDEFFVEYQPIVSLSSGKLEAFEVLLRWRHPRRGPLRPVYFIDDAERCGALTLLTPKILEAALSANADWNRAGGRRAPIAVSINLCGAQLRDPELVPNVAAAIEASGVAPDSVWFEITENTGARHALAHLDTLHDLRQVGAKLALDDFGTGCASIGCLRNLPIDAVKIDRSLIIQAAASVSGARVLAASAEIARALGITVVAEGIERREQLDLVRALGCELGQGFYFAPPLNRTEADRIAALPAPLGATTPTPQVSARPRLDRLRELRAGPGSREPAAPVVHRR
jgi:EAL domain-containing protein (putative c-di-GMP-specific phosphodiesterase class I)